MFLKFSFFFLALLSFLPLQATLVWDFKENCQSLAIGPESYYVKRTREGGTWQTGWVNGVRGTYERLKPCGMYWAITGLYATGTLKGKSALKSSLKSTFTDREIEGRLGYTFMPSFFFKPSLTPFIGYGYYSELNNYKHPSPLPLHFETNYSYFAFGFLSTLYTQEAFTAGFNAKGMAMNDATCCVTNDPNFPSTTLSMESNVNFRLELPLKYAFCPFSVGIIPFYEKRHYGGRFNADFDFPDTKIQIYGINLEIRY